MTYARRVDGNHAVIKKAFEQCGCSVVDLSRVGGGVADLLVAIPHFNMLVEVKPVGVGIRKDKRGEKQRAFHAEWKGPKAVVRTVQEAAELVGKMGEWSRRKSA
jgi:hypothetical protein